jgi:hypothetical protein
MKELTQSKSVCSALLRRLMSQQAKGILEYNLFSNRKGNKLHSEQVLCSERHLSGARRRGGVRAGLHPPAC